MSGPSFLHIELCSRCNKSCPMCGRRKMERDHPELCNWGDMPYEMVEEVARQVPSGAVTQFHINGESLLHPRFGECVSLFKHTIRCMDTNGKLLVEKADEIIGNLETLTISVVEGDEEQEEQYEIVNAFIKIKQDRPPRLVYRVLGKCGREADWQRLPGVIAKRVLHSPMGSFRYDRQTTIPEIGICLDLLTHLAIDRFGLVSPCVRFDPKREGVIGSLTKNTIGEIWGGVVRKHYLDCHIKGHREYLHLCSKCEYWGCANSP